jgi:hypothetical protein
MRKSVIMTIVGLYQQGDRELWQGTEDFETEAPFTRIFSPGKPAEVSCFIYTIGYYDHMI